MAEPVDTTPENSSVPDILSDCRVMLRFALKEGFELPQELQANVVWLDCALKHFNLAPISALPGSLIPDEVPRGAAQQAANVAGDVGISPAEMALKVYAGLSKVVAPATALTLQVSEPPPGKHRFLGGMPPLVKAASYIALLCAFGFAVTALPVVSEKLDGTKTQGAVDRRITETELALKKATADNDATTKTANEADEAVRKATEAQDRATTDADKETAAKALVSAQEAAKKAADLSSAAKKAFGDANAANKAARDAKAKLEAKTKLEVDAKVEQKNEGSWTSLLSMFNIFFGAGLGAAFYILLNTKELLVNRSYDPKYNAVYVARLITGLVGGVILATTLGPTLMTQAEQTSGSSFTPGLFAILGGFAADAVQQLLQRLVEVLLTVVRGDATAEAQAKAKAAQIERNAQATSKLMEYEREADPEKKKTRLAELFSILKT